MTTANVSSNGSNIKKSSWCISDIEEEEFDFTWTIKKYYEFDDKETGHEKIISSTFKGGNHDWQVQITPKYKADDDLEYMSLYLRLVKVYGADKTTVKARFSVDILDESGQVKFHRGPTGTDFTPESGWGWEQFCKTSKISKYLVKPTSALILKVCVWITGNRKQIAGTSFEQPSKETHLQGLSQHMLTLLDNEEFSDLTITTKTKHFHVHKIILSGKTEIIVDLPFQFIIFVLESNKKDIYARSNVFLAMFRSTMVESIQNVLEIDDFDADVVKSMLEYIYSGDTSSLQERAPDLLQIADKYELLDLKAECEQVMEFNLTIENAADFFILARLHNAEKLKNAVMSFMRNFKSQVWNTESFNRLVKSSDAAAICMELYLNEEERGEKRDLTSSGVRTGNITPQCAKRQKIMSMSSSEDDSEDSD